MSLSGPSPRLCLAYFRRPVHIEDLREGEKVVDPGVVDHGRIQTSETSPAEERSRRNILKGEESAVHSGKAESKTDGYQFWKRKGC